MNKKSFVDYVFFEWHSVLRDIIRNIWTVVLAALIGFMGVYIAEHSVYTPEYTSSAMVVVNVKTSSSAANINITMASEMAEVFSDVFKQSSMKKKAAEYIGESSFGGSISSSVLGDTNFVKISVTSSSPEMAYRLLQSVLTVYPEISENIFGNAVLDVVKQPQMPHSPSNVLSNKKTVAVAFAMAVLTGCVVVALSVFRNTVKTEEQFENSIDAAIIGTIPHEKKKKSFNRLLKKNKTPLLISNNSFLSLRFTESYQKIVTKIEHLQSDEDVKVISVVSVAENEGKTTAAANIAIMLAGRGNKVLLFDLDAKKPALNKIFDIKDSDPNAEVGELLNGNIDYNKFNFRRFNKTSLFMASNRKAYKNYQKWFESGSVERTINHFRDMFDYIIIDTAPMSVDAMVTNVVSLTDRTIMVVRSDIVRAPSINDAVLTIKRVGGNLAGCVFNDVYSEFSLFGQSGSSESSYYGSGRYGYGRYSYGKRYKDSSYGRYGRYGNYGYGGYGYGYGYESTNDELKDDMVLEKASDVESEDGGQI